MSSADASGDESIRVHDPFAPIQVSPTGSGLLVALAAIAGITAMLGGLSPLTGPIGMLLGLVAHVKGHRLGMPVTIAAGIMMIAGMTFTLYLR